jgi:hypothetical protein
MSNSNTEKAEARGSLELKSLRPARATQENLVSRKKVNLPLKVALNTNQTS